MSRLIPRKSALGALSSILSSLALAGACLFAPAASWAQERVDLFAGGTLDVASVGYLGATIALPGSTIGQGLAVRASAFGGGFNYIGGPLSQRIDGQFSGGEVDAMYQYTNSGFWADIGVGGRYVHTTLTPNDPTNRRRGDKGELSLVTDGGNIAGPWRVDWYGGYGTSLDDYQARLSLTHALSSPYWRGGVEAYAEGDPTYNIQRIGPLVAFTYAQRSEIQVSAGYSEGSARRSGAYLRVGVNKGF